MAQLEFLTPVGGRLVSGDLYEKRKGKLDSPEKEPTYYFALAIPKIENTHWSKTEWGQQIFFVGKASFAGEKVNLKNFSWKVKDGDSSEQATPDVPPFCERDGFAGHWIVQFKSAIHFQITDHSGKKIKNESVKIKLGDYIRVYASVKGNNSIQSPGVFINPKAVSLTQVGPEIIIPEKDYTDVFSPKEEKNVLSPQSFNPKPQQAIVFENEEINKAKPQGKQSQWSEEVTLGQVSSFEDDDIPF